MGELVEVEELAFELVDEVELAFVLEEVELTFELEEVELAFELEEEVELVFELEDEVELAFELEDEELVFVPVDEAPDVVEAALELALEALDDDVELACDEALDDVVCPVMLFEFQMYASSLPGPPQISLELPLQVMVHCKLPSTAGPPPFMRALPQ